jgi:hypothetical protein
MEIPVLVEPRDSGFVASTQTPVPLSATGTTEDAAVDALRSLIAEKLKAGGKLRTIKFMDVEGIIAAGNALASNPFHAEWLKGVEEYRREHNTVPDAD